MRRAILLILAILLSTAAGRAQQKPQDQFLTAHTIRIKRPTPPPCQYLLFLPRDYASKKNEKWPLMLFLHGAGERGTNIWRADIHGPARYIATHPDFPFLMVAPLCPSNEVWSTGLLLGLLDGMESKYRIDTHRVYLTGLSMGGFGTWELALAAPQRFAAVIPIAGGANDLPVVLARTGFASPEQKAALQSLPVWAFHGAKDTVVDPDDSTRMIDGLKKCGVAEAKITIYPDATHNSWQRTYENPEIYDWLLQHRR